MYTEDQVAEMVEAVEKEEVEAAAKKVMFHRMFGVRLLLFFNCACCIRN